jgi:uncharacterized protein DUF1549/uncharacterized protein DUF1553
MISHRFRQPVLTWLLGGFVIACLAAVVATDNAAQAQKGKTDKKTADSKDKEGKTKESKTEKAPTNFPARKDYVDPAFGGVQHVTMIDDQIKDGWKKNSTFPSERCTDYEFVRRASLDIIGRIPTVEEVKKFMAQPEGKRRSWLINAMLDGPEYGNGREYAQNFANLWTVLLMTRSGSSHHSQQQMNDWLYNHFKGDEKNTPNWTTVVKELVAGAGETNTNNAVNYLLHNMGEEVRVDTGNGPKNAQLDTAKNGRWDMVPATSRTTRLFLGIRTQCVQCHNHPFNGEWKQENFWGINAFFRQLDTGPNGRPMMVMKKKKDKAAKSNFEYKLVDKADFNINKLVPYEPRNNLLLYTDPTFLDGKKIPKDFKGTRREALAKFMLDSPYVSKAFVNRTWGHFFGKSFTRDGVDDFHEGNPPSYPELLDKLSEDWATQYGYNPKVLVRWICNSQAYGLSSRANKWNDKIDDETLFARMLLKPMTPEQMFESIVYATTPQDGGGEIFRKRVEKRMESKEGWLDKLVVSFGNDEGEEGNFSGTVVQALMLMNGQDINNAISDPKEGAVAAVIKKRGASYPSLKVAINDMYMQVLGRPASDKEMFDMTFPGNSQKSALFHFRKDAPGTVSNNPQFWTNYYQDIMWALLNSNEFILNH